MARVKYTTCGVGVPASKAQNGINEEHGEHLQFGFGSNGFKRVRLSPVGGSLATSRNGQQHHHHREQHHALASLTAAFSGTFSRMHTADGYDDIFCTDDALGLEATIAANRLLHPLNLRHAQEAITKAGMEVARQLDCCKLLVAGAASAVVSRTCVAPLERVKMDLVLKSGTGEAWSTAQQVFAKEGVPGFWRGNVVNLVRTAPFKVCVAFASC